MVEKSTPKKRSSANLSSCSTQSSQQSAFISRGVRTVQNIYFLTNPRSGDGYASRFLEQYPRENRCSIEVVVTRKNGAIQFVLPANYNAKEGEKVQMVTLECTLYLFNVLQAEERALCMQMMEGDIAGPGHENRDRYLGIMGGDGSLATTLKMLRTRPTIEAAMKQKLVGFVMLPFGTGCDAAQIFGWGNLPQDEEWMDRIDALTEEIVTAENDALSVWQITVHTRRSLKAAAQTKDERHVFEPKDDIDVGIYNAHDQPVKANSFLMCCYWNIGFEPRVGIRVERTRVKSRCMNKLKYGLITAYEALCRRGRNQIKQYVHKVVSRPNSAMEAVRADLSIVPSNPYNLVGCNITSLYGGLVTKANWKSSANRVLKAPNQRQRSSDLWTSCDESDSTSIEQRYDDDKLELTCYEHWWSFLIFSQSRFGQVRSPFDIEFRDKNVEQSDDSDEDNEPINHDEDISLAIDGECYWVRGGKNMQVQLDPTLPKIRVARRLPVFKDMNQIMLDLNHLSPPFV